MLSKPLNLVLSFLFLKKSIYDFSNFENIGKKLDYFKNKKFNTKFKGFDTTFIIKKNIKNYVGTLKNNNTNIQVDFFSNLPGVQLYSAQNLNYKKKFISLSRHLFRNTIFS